MAPAFRGGADYCTRDWKRAPYSAEKRHVVPRVSATTVLICSGCDAVRSTCDFVVEPQGKVLDGAHDTSYRGGLNRSVVEVQANDRNLRWH